jgi:hypothetical protein
VLIREAGRTFPAKLAAVDAFVPPWLAPPRARAAAGPGAGSGSGSGTAGGPAAGPVGELLTAHPATTDALAGLLGLAPGWLAAASPASGPEPLPLLSAHPETAAALATLLAVPV